MADSNASRFPLRFPRDEKGKPDPQLIEKFKRESPSGHVFIFEDRVVGEIVYRPASQNELDYWVDTLKEDNTAGPNRTLFDSCVVWPADSDKLEIHKRRSGLAGSVVKEILRVSGADKITGKEL